MPLLHSLQLEKVCKVSCNVSIILSLSSSGGTTKVWLTEVGVRSHQAQSKYLVLALRLRLGAGFPLLCCGIQLVKGEW